eukprot:CCRYP_005691-RA/>CCRYP_005691-RA protein AED:0.25 eAED:-0.48 QI:0/-1/0/1/-1/1/1/0/462
MSIHDILTTTDNTPKCWASQRRPSYFLNISCRPAVSFDAAFLLTLTRLAKRRRRHHVKNMHRVSDHVNTASAFCHHCSDSRQRRSGKKSSTPLNGETFLANKGVYIDLGSLEEPRYSSVSDSGPTLEIDADFASNKYETRTAEDALKEWRAKHWVVLIDDEPSIRLAIGDYLHSMGYKFVTACDGPMSFLEMLLWTCGWSFLDKNANDNIMMGNNGCPPCLEETSKFEEHPWRLPSIVISDIRMPGGIDGVQLLELLRQHRPSARDIKPNRENAAKNLDKKKKRTKKTAKAAFDDDEDTNDIERPDTNILEGWVEFTTPISTPTDQAMKLLDAIHNTIEYCKRHTSPKSTPYHPEAIEDIPVILLTAKAMVSDRIKGYKAGADGYLPKPFRPEELLRMVDGLIRRQDRERSYQMTHTSYNSEEFNDSMNDDQALSSSRIEEIINELREIKKLLQQVMDAENH